MPFDSRDFQHLTDLSKAQRKYILALFENKSANHNQHTHAIKKKEIEPYFENYTKIIEKISNLIKAIEFTNDSKDIFNVLNVNQLKHTNYITSLTQLEYIKSIVENHLLLENIKKSIYLELYDFDSIKILCEETEENIIMFLKIIEKIIIMGNKKQIFNPYATIDFDQYIFDEYINDIKKALEKTLTEVNEQKLTLHNQFLNLDNIFSLQLDGRFIQEAETECENGVNTISAVYRQKKSSSSVNTIDKNIAIHIELDLENNVVYLSSKKIENKDAFISRITSHTLKQTCSINLMKPDSPNMTIKKIINQNESELPINMLTICNAILTLNLDDTLYAISLPLKYLIATEKDNYSDDPKITIYLNKNINLKYWRKNFKNINKAVAHCYNHIVKKNNLTTSKAIGSSCKLSPIYQGNYLYLFSQPTTSVELKQLLETQHIFLIKLYNEKHYHSRIGESINKLQLEEIKAIRCLNPKKEKSDQDYIVLYLDDKLSQEKLAHIIHKVNKKLQADYAKIAKKENIDPVGSLCEKANPKFIYSSPDKEWPNPALLNEHPIISIKLIHPDVHMFTVFNHLNKKIQLSPKLTSAILCIRCLEDPTIESKLFIKTDKHCMDVIIYLKSNLSLKEIKSTIQMINKLLSELYSTLSTNSHEEIGSLCQFLEQKKQTIAKPTHSAPVSPRSRLLKEIPPAPSKQPSSCFNKMGSSSLVNEKNLPASDNNVNPSTNVTLFHGSVSCGTTGLPLITKNKKTINPEELRARLRKSQTEAANVGTSPSCDFDILQQKMRKKISATPSSTSSANSDNDETDTPSSSSSVERTQSTLFTSSSFEHGNKTPPISNIVRSLQREASLTKLSTSSDLDNQSQQTSFHLGSRFALKWGGLFSGSSQKSCPSSPRQRASSTEIEAEVRPTLTLESRSRSK